MDNLTPLAGQVAVVTGATRGIGRGIALQLGEAGATVYITGRTLKSKGNSKLSLEGTAEEIESRGGKGIPVQCDHSKDEEIKALFDRVKAEQHGRLDILVNNAYSAVERVLGNINQPFWEQEPEIWDDVNNVGLRNHYVCSVYAARLMIPRKRGLIVNISSMGGLNYLFNVAYGVGKAAVDRLAADTAHDLKKYNIASVSLWPASGPVQTELAIDMLDDSKIHVEGVPADMLKHVWCESESTEYSGKCIVALATDPNIMQMTGKVLLTAELGTKYGFKDINGKCPPNMRSISTLLRMGGYIKLASWIPSWLKIPMFIWSAPAYKF
ncbi:dehydrogenase/reductase SDR family member 1-like [Lingula anatina]|uniref:Dehydrogenase/reductase SDR family member 1-like n=1 Tax=Lingula anatina TaxID=7574 RepID=A0A1S3H765_LINAN|nr:dehydrogenase/reductase SDR family member 1-like [Lingula anatina]|eukprot:XP_013381822.1 dehydrogenase/reductase SDR family member 1-like [Lingula anatina]